MINLISFMVNSTVMRLYFAARYYSTDVVIIISEKRAVGTPTKGHNIKEQPIDPSLLSQGVETSSRMTVEEPTNFLYTPSRSRNSPFTMSYGKLNSCYFSIILTFNNFFVISTITVPFEHRK